MEYIKKHPIYVFFVTISVVAFTAGIVFSVLSYLELDKASRNFIKADKSFKQLVNSRPSPTLQNVEISNENVLALQERLESIRNDLERGKEPLDDIGGNEVVEKIKNFQREFKELASSNYDENGMAPIEIPEKFGFGFDRFSSKSSPPKDQKEINMLYQQVEILRYLLTKLYESNPKSLISIKRESAKINEGGIDDESFYTDSSIFNINSAISARVEGAIETLAFEISFMGKTNSLRQYLNDLSEFNMPIVVRSINVNRPEVSIKINDNFNNYDQEFDIFGDEVKKIQEEQKKEPVVTDNISEFTLTLEYFRIVLPEDDFTLIEEDE